LWTFRIAQADRTAELTSADSEVLLTFQSEM